MSKGRVYLLLGPEQGEKSRELRRIKELVAKEAEEVEEHRFYAFETPVQEALSLLRSGSLFAGHTLCVLHGAEQIKRAEDIELLEGYLERPSETGTLVLLTDEFRIKDPRRNKDWTKKIPDDNRKIFWEMFENQKRDWLSTFFRRRYVEVEDEAIELILELVDNNTLDLKRAAGRLAMFVGEGGRLTAEEVETYLYHSKEENVFTLFRAVVDRDLEASAELLRKLLLSSDNSPQSIVAGLLWQLRKLHSLSTLTSRNYSLEEACRTAGIRGKRNQRLYGDALSAFDGEAAERMLVRATEADADLRKYNSRVHELLLDRLLYSIIVDAGRAPAATHSLESPARPLSPSPR